MAREYSSSVSDSGGARRTAAVLAVILLLASALAPASIAVAVANSETTANDETTTVANDETTTVANDDTTTVANDDTTTVSDAAANDESVTIRGYVENASEERVANATVQLERADGNVTDEDSTDETPVDENHTDEGGRYVLRGEQNRSYDLIYRQGDGSARDGLPDVYAVGRVNTSVGGANASTNVTRNVSLPAASVLNVTVVAENRTRVGNATVRVTHVSEGANATGGTNSTDYANATITGRTDERGRLMVGGRVGVEVAGNVTVAVEAPNASLFDATVALSVANATERDVVLPLNDTDPPTLRYDVSPNPVNVSEPVTFDARDSTDESGIEGTTWTIRNETFHEPNLTVSFSEPVTYTVDLSATDWASNENETEVTVTVVDERAPDPALTTNATTVETRESVRFDASNASDTHRIAEYRWDFDGDGMFDESTNNSTATHAYEENGSYTATVVVVDATGNRASARRQLTVHQPPTADFSVTKLDPGIDEQVRFDASPSTATTNITNYTWTVEGNWETPYGRTFNTSFPDSRTYNVTLTVTDGHGRTDERVRTIEVPNEYPVAQAGENRSVVAGTDLALDASDSTDPHDDFSVHWTQTSEFPVALSDASAVEPTFTAPDVNETKTLRFELTVTDDHGATDADSVAVTVAPRTGPNVSHDPANPTVGESVTFEANRTGRYRWDFDGDGIPEATPKAANVTDATGTHEFDEAGEYDVTLIDTVGRAVVHPVTITEASESEVSESEPSGGGSSARVASTGGNLGGSSSMGGSGGSGGLGGSGGSGDSGDSSRTGDGGDQSGGGVDGDDSATDDDRNATGSSNEQSAESLASPSVTVESANEDADRVLASVRNASTGDPAEVRLPEGFGGTDSAFETVTVVTDGASNYSLSVSGSADRPDGPPSPNADAVLSYLEVEKRNVTDAEISSARFSFRIAVSVLDEAGVHPKSVTLHRYSGGKWEALSTTLTGERDRFYRFEADSPGFSVFAIGVGTNSTNESIGGSSDESTETATQAPTQTDGDEDGGGSADATATGDSVEKDSTKGDSADESSTESKRTSGGFSGFGGNAVLLGLFGVALVGAALWGYLLS